MCSSSTLSYRFFFFNDTATTEIYTLSLHDALPIYIDSLAERFQEPSRRLAGRRVHRAPRGDRKSTRLNSSHDQISYAVFCLKKKKHMRTSRRQNTGECLITRWRAIHRSTVAATGRS